MSQTLRWQKSSFSAGDSDNDCLEIATAPTPWQKSSFSGGGEDTSCLEISTTPTTLHLRESDTPATILSPTPTALHALLAALRDGPRTPPQG
ncbi:DUF397 domain-containing protein [Streptomyces caniscabiei]|uniref:DUF397 domain-containing protein n=1 Tax=Streptomyces caniscabiei TaxID=2746961 RepID=UPI000AEA283A